MMETALVFDGNGRTLHWHEPLGRSAGHLPDSRDLWHDVIWPNREVIGGIAHTHPWDGPAHPSDTDLTTFRAIEQGLGRRLVWPVVTFTDVVYLTWDPETESYSGRRPQPSSPARIECLKNLLDGIEELRGRSRVLPPVTPNINP
jgi:hypothetical protein